MPKSDVHWPLLRIGEQSNPSFQGLREVVWEIYWGRPMIERSDPGQVLIAAEYSREPLQQLQ